MEFQGRISLRPLAAVVSAIAERKIDIVWGRYEQLRGQLGHANSELIRLHWLLGQNMDRRAPYIFWHEAAHVLLPKGSKTSEQREAEANHFADMMMERNGGKIFWDLLTMFNGLGDGESRDLDDILQMITNKASEPQTRRVTTMGGSTQRNMQRETRSAAQVEAEGRREEELAAKVQATNPTLAAMIRNSAVGKVEHAMALRGRSVNPANSKYEKRIEHCVSNVSFNLITGRR